MAKSIVSQKAFLSFGFALLALTSLSFGQVEFSKTPRQAQTAFFFDAITFISDIPGKSRLDVYVQIPFEELHFVKVADEYIAGYEVSTQILDRDQQVVDQRSSSKEERVKDFNQTTADRASSFSHQSIDLTPGHYEIDVEVVETETQKRTRQRKSILVSDFSRDSLGFSDIMLVNRLTKIGDKTGVIPNVSGSFSRQTDGFYLYFEAYHISTVDSLLLTCHIFGPNKLQVWQKEQAEPPSDTKLQIFVKVDSTTFDAGNYLVVVEGFNARLGSSAGLKTTTSRTFTIRWSDIPPTITDIDKAIEEMRYIAKVSELDHIREGKTIDDRRRLFLEFWGRRDPDPTTVRNELMEEYYRRVEFANKTFTRYMEGWRSDMGMVYIRLGPPENIERHPFEMSSKPYEIWYYYQLDRQVVFIDFSGFGDYRIQNPTDDLFRGLR